jgi:hypothetical protein
VERAFKMWVCAEVVRHSSRPSTSGKRGLVLEKLRLLWVSLETIKTSKTQRLPGLPQNQVP